MKNKQAVIRGSIFGGISLVLAIVGSVIFGTFAKAPVEFKANYEDELNFYDSSYDMRLVSPSKTQISEIKNLDYVSNITESCHVYTKFKTADGTQSSIDGYVFKDFNSLSNTDFTNDRLIESSDLKDNSVFIDYNFAKRNNLKLNDTITISAKEHVVSRIYRTNYDYKTGVVALNASYLSNAYNYNNVFINTNNVSKLNEYLKDYKPMGAFLEKTEYQTEEEYQEYVDRFNNADYSSYKVAPKNQISSVDDFYKTRISKAETNLWVFSCVYGVVVLGYILGSLFIKFKAKRKYVVDNGSKVLTVLYSVVGSIATVATLIGFIIAATIIPGLLTGYATTGLALIQTIPMIVVASLFGLVGTIIDIFTIRKL